MHSIPPKLLYFDHSMKCERRGQAGVEAELRGRAERRRCGVDARQRRLQAPQVPHSARGRRASRDRGAESRAEGRRGPSCVSASLGHPFRSPNSAVPRSVRSWILALPPRVGPAPWPPALLSRRHPAELRLLLDEGGKGPSGFSCWSVKELERGCMSRGGGAQLRAAAGNRREPRAQRCGTAAVLWRTRAALRRVRCGGCQARACASAASAHGSVLFVLPVHLETEMLPGWGLAALLSGANGFPGAATPRALGATRVQQSSAALSRSQRLGAPLALRGRMKPQRCCRADAPRCTQPPAKQSLVPGGGGFRAWPWHALLPGSNERGENSGPCRGEEKNPL